MRVQIKVNQVWIHPGAYSTSKFLITSIVNGLVKCIRFDDDRGIEQAMTFGYIDSGRDQMSISDQWKLLDEIESIDKLRERLLDQQRRKKHADKYL